MVSDFKLFREFWRILLELSRRQHGGRILLIHKDDLSRIHEKKILVSKRDEAHVVEGISIMDEKWFDVCLNSIELDGATVITDDGVIRKIAQEIRQPERTSKQPEELSVGEKQEERSTSTGTGAAAVKRFVERCIQELEISAIGIKVSQDGPITLFFHDGSEIKPWITSY